MAKKSFKNVLIYEVFIIYLLFSTIIFFVFLYFYVENAKRNVISANEFALKVANDYLVQEMQNMGQYARQGNNDSNVYLAVKKGIYLEMTPESESGYFKEVQMNKLNYKLIASRIKSRLFTGYEQKVDRNVIIYNKQGDVLGSTINIDNSDKSFKEIISNMIGNNLKWGTFTSMIRFINNSYYIEGVGCIDLNYSYGDGAVAITENLDYYFLDDIKRITNKEVFLLREDSIYESTIFEGISRLKGIKIAFNKENINKAQEISVSNQKLVMNFFPIKDYFNKTIGYIGVGSYYTVYDSFLKKTLQWFLISQLFLSLFLLLILRFYLTKVLRPLKKILEVVDKNAMGQNVTFEVEKTGNEFEELGNSINTMVEERTSKDKEYKRINQVYSNFVPYDFLKFLDKNDILEVQHGDQVLKRMTIMFSDIRSFTVLSEKMTTFENFNFLNSYLRRMGPVVREHNGVVDKYLGDSMMSLYPDCVDDAIDAAVEMQRKIIEYNSDRKKASYDPISIGIGIHVGKLMLGIIGEDNRMETTVVSDAVNLASRLEVLTKYYNAGILVSGTVLFECRKKYNYRFLDKVKVKGKNEPISVYEILDGLDESVVKFKIKNKKELDIGIYYYQGKELEEALRYFKKALDINKEDRIAQIYVKRCEELLKNGVTEDWAGIEILE